MSKSVHISITLPSIYSVIRRAKEESYPFSRTFDQYLASLYHLQVQKGLNIQDLFGYLEFNLASPMMLTDDNLGLIKIDYLVKDQDAIKFLKQDNNITIKWILRRSLQFYARLYSLGIVSLDAAIYFINNFDTALEQIKQKGMQTQSVVQTQPLQDQLNQPLSKPSNAIINPNRRAKRKSLTSIAPSSSASAIEKSANVVTESSSNDWTFSSLASSNHSSSKSSAVSSVSSESVSVRSTASAEDNQELGFTIKHTENKQKPKQQNSYVSKALTFDDSEIKKATEDAEKATKEFTKVSSGGQEGLNEEKGKKVNANSALGDFL